jgi:hypothetical protein
MSLLLLLKGGEGSAEPAPGERIAVTREFPPDKLAIRVEPPGGAPVRYAFDEPGVENVIDDVKYSGELNGGEKEASWSLARDPRVNYGDLPAFADVEVYGAGAETRWQGRVDKATESDGERKSVDPAAVGHKAALEDIKGIVAGFIDGDFGKWGEPSVQRRLNLNGSSSRLTGSVSNGWQGTGETAPGVTMDFNDVETANGKSDRGEVWYYGGGPDIGALLYHFARLAGGAGAEWLTRADLSSDELASSTKNGTNHEANTNSAPYETVSSGGAEGLRYALIRSSRTESGEGGAHLGDIHAWQWPKVLGNQGLDLQGEWPDVGFTAKQMLAWAIPQFSYLELDEDDLEDDGFVIPQAWFGDPTTLLAIIEELTKYGLLDWFVRGKRFNLRFPGTYGRRWQLYAGPSGLKDQGLDASRLWRSIVVRWQDVDGTTKSIGPPGSGAMFEDAGLEIIDPDHPAVRAGIARQDILDLNGIGVQSQALATGERWLEEANLLSRSGSCTASYYAMDDRGIYRPVSEIREGDLARFPDSGKDTSYRKIQSYEYTHSTRSNSLALDAPRESIIALLARFNAKLTSAGIS